MRIVRAHAEILGFGRDFAVYDPTDQKTVVKNIIKELGLDGKKYTPAYFLSVIGKCKEQKLSAAQYIEHYGEDLKTKLIWQVYDRYEKTLKKNNAMDFDDLLLNVVLWWTNTRIRTRFSMNS